MIGLLAYDFPKSRVGEVNRLKVFLKCCAVFLLSVVLMFGLFLMWNSIFHTFQYSQYIVFICSGLLYFVIYYLIEKAIKNRTRFPVKYYLTSSIVLPLIVSGIAYGVVKYLTFIHYFSGWNDLVSLVLTLVILIISAEACFLRLVIGAWQSLKRK